MDQTVDNSIGPLIAFGIIAMLFLAIAIILFIVVYQRRLSAQQTSILEMEIDNQRNSLVSLIQGQEAERRRIAQELHDGIGAQLSASKMYINKLGEGKSDKEVVFIKQEAGGLIDETIDNIRSITRNLLPTSLERFGLFAAVEDLCKRVNDLGAMKVIFTHSGDVRLDGQQEFTLYRIVQELINNALKYSEADSIALQLNLANNELQLTYQDDGKGFDLEQYKADKTQQNGLGLAGIETRAEVLRAKLQMESKPSLGFFLQLTLKM